MLLLPFPDSEAETSLAVLEAIIETRLQAFKSVATALREIHDKRLYRFEYVTWPEYLRRRWRMSKTRGYDILGEPDAAPQTEAMEALTAKVVAGMSPEQQRDLIESQQVRPETPAETRDRNVRRARRAVGTLRSVAEQLGLQASEMLPFLAAIADVLDRLPK